MNDAVVIGGGPAGAACALWLHQLGMDVRLLEAGPAVGGLQLRSPYTNRWIPGMRGRTGQQVAAELQDHLLDASVPHTVDFEVTAIRQAAGGRQWEVAGGRAVHRARHVVIATGSKPRRGGFVESDCVGIGPGIAMERIAVEGRRVAILGGGDNAFDQAGFALRRGAASVEIFTRSAPRAQPILQRQIAVEAVHAGPFHADSQAMTVNGQPFDVFGVQFGFEASIPGALRLALDDGYIEVDRSGAVPGLPGLYAAGEVTNFWHPCVTTAYAHGVQVAKSIQNAEMAGVAGMAAAMPIGMASGPHARGSQRCPEGATPPG
jgi:thioredoxin reductase